jgi:hydrogenase maturation protein HypF
MRCESGLTMTSACTIRVHGVVQGVGFRPYVYRLARQKALAGWVLNGDEGVEIRLEGRADDLEAFVEEMRSEPPTAATISAIEVESVAMEGLSGFTIRESAHAARPTVRVSPDLPVCDECLAELFDESDRRYLYPYINCTNCGPRYSVILGLPYDRGNTTMHLWTMCEACDAEYHDPSDRRFHAQPSACGDCGPQVYLVEAGLRTADARNAVRRAAELLREGKIVAIKGLGGYHLACDARNTSANQALRERKFRKEKPFAIMARDVEVARELVYVTPETEALMKSAAGPIVVAPGRVELPGVAPENRELGIMLPYTPLQHLLFAEGVPDALVMTSANRSSEPIAFEDEDAMDRLSEIADAFLAGDRPIARRIEDSLVRSGAYGPVILRRARGYAPGAVAAIPSERPILALGADLKNTITLVVNGQAFVSQHIGDLDHYQSFRAFEETIDDLLSMYEVDRNELLLVHDAHPQYKSTVRGMGLDVEEKVEVQHHRAHVASVIAERGEWERRILGISFDGTGYGDDGKIWGGEFFVGSVSEGLNRVAHLREAVLPGGDASAQFPVQAAAGFLAQLEDLPDMTASPFLFPERFENALTLVRRGIRTFSTTSMGRLFDTAAALLGFTREVEFEGQAAMWVEHLAGGGKAHDDWPFPYVDGELDFRPLLMRVIQQRKAERDRGEIARGFQRAVAVGMCEAARSLCGEHGLDTIVLSGGVFQNDMLLRDVKDLLRQSNIDVWTNHAVPANDGGISLGQAALAAFLPGMSGVGAQAAARRAAR